MEILNFWYQLKTRMNHEASSLVTEIFFKDWDFGKRHLFRVSKLSAKRTYIDAWLNTESGESDTAMQCPPVTKEETIYLKSRASGLNLQLSKMLLSGSKTDSFIGARDQIQPSSKGASSNKETRLTISGLWAAFVCVSGAEA